MGNGDAENQAEKDLICMEKISPRPISLGLISPGPISPRPISLGLISPGANLKNVIVNTSTKFWALQCPESGQYTAWKKAGGLIIELEIPADAQRSSATSRKCRASKARVISITNTDGVSAGNHVCSDYDPNFVYTVGETMEVSNFDTNRWNERAPGIHHYITRQEAVQHV